MTTRIEKSASAIVAIFIFGSLRLLFERE